jgi:hypothetical protein
MEVAKMPAPLRAMTVFGAAVVAAVLVSLLLAFLGVRAPSDFADRYGGFGWWVPWLWAAGLPYGAVDTPKQRRGRVRFARQLMGLSVALGAIELIAGTWAPASRVLPHSGTPWCLVWLWGIPVAWLAVLRSAGVREWAAPPQSQELRAGPQGVTRSPDGAA